MKTYIVTIKPCSGFGTPIKGDTLFGNICWQIAYHEGLWETSLEKLLEKETTLSKPQLFKTLQGALDSETRLIPHIEKCVKATPSGMVFLTGIGSVFPFIRSHTVLNNLQNSIKDRPTVMFFPGTYGSDLSLFGKMKDDNYYRAFNLDTLNL